MNDQQRQPSQKITMADFIRPTTIPIQSSPSPPSPAQSNTNKAPKNLRGEVEWNTPTNNNNLHSTTRQSNNNNDEQDSTLLSSSFSLPYSMRATKGGDVPCVVEKRKHHKVVIIRNVKGDVHALLSSLQKTLGTGGVCRSGGSIEIQGEHHLEKVRIFCLNSGCVLGASKKNKDYAAKIAKGGGNNGNGNGKNGNNKKNNTNKEDEPNNNNSEINNNNNNNNNRDETTTAPPPYTSIKVHSDLQNPHREQAV